MRARSTASWASSPVAVRRPKRPARSATTRPETASARLRSGLPASRRARKTASVIRPSSNGTIAPSRFRIRAGLGLGIGNPPAEVPDEPAGGVLCHALERSRLLEQVRRARDDDELVLAGEEGGRLPGELDDDVG